MTKKLLTERCKTLLYQAALSKEEQDFLLKNVFCHHPERNQKLKNVTNIYSAPAPGGVGTRCFWVKRRDGTITDISYITAIRNITPRNILWQKESDVQKACRHAILNQINMVRKRHGDHVHHITPFNILLANWKTRHGYTTEFLHSFVTPVTDGSCDCEFTDKKLLRSWQAFHKKYAKLVSLKAEDHYLKHSNHK